MEKLAEETKRLLKRIYQDSSSYQVRRQSHQILLRNEGWSIQQIANILNVSKKMLCYRPLQH